MSLILVGIASIGLAVNLTVCLPKPTAPREIFHGVTYQCFEVGSSGHEGSAQLVEVDLAAAGVGLHATPLDPAAVLEGCEYRLAYAGSVARKEDLAVVINGGPFQSKSGWLPLSGGLARSGETLVADRVVNHIDPQSYLLWFEDDLTPHLEKDKPPSDTALQSARWAISGRDIALSGGKVSPHSRTEPDRRTAVGIDTARKRLWLAAFEYASERLVAETLARVGAQDAILLDGGSSTVMYISRKAARGPTGRVLGGYRPVATFLGIRAQPLLSALCKPAIRKSQSCEAGPQARSTKHEAPPDLRPLNGSGRVDDSVLPFGRVT